MTVNDLILEGFRNYRKTAVCFSESVNVITGGNAQGKTNLVEALFYLATGRSFRTRTSRDLIIFGGSGAYIKANIVSQGRTQKMEARIFSGRRREFFVNSVRLKSASELSGKLTAVLFCPDDLEIIREGAAARRKLMDNCLCQLRPRYAAVLTEFGRLYEEKTRILRDYREKPSLLDTLDDFNYRLAQTGAELISYRAAFVKRLSEKASAIHGEFSGGAECLKISYKTVSTIDNAEKKPNEILPLLLEHQKTHRQAELESGLCLSGAHKDDLFIEINGSPARSFASQGQARTAALSLKLAEREIHFTETGEYPILLLDDVLSELDQSRQNFVLNRLGKGQVFITCCEDARIKPGPGGKVLKIENGDVAE